MRYLTSNLEQSRKVHIFLMSVIVFSKPLRVLQGRGILMKLAVSQRNITSTIQVNLSLYGMTQRRPVGLNVVYFFLELTTKSSSDSEKVRSSSLNVFPLNIPNRIKHRRLSRSHAYSEVALYPRTLNKRQFS